MSETAAFLPFGSIGFTSVAVLTLFFSAHRKLFIRIFVPADELRKAVRGLQDPAFRTGLRLMAALQFAVLGCVWIAFLIARLCW